ncbi:MAG: tyrosine-type recombinase/integrase [Chloroflexota bacterium]
MTDPTEPQLLILFQEYLVHQGMAPATIRNYLADINSFSRWYTLETANGASLLDCSAADLRTFCATMDHKGLAVSTINRRLQALRKFGQFTVEAGLREHNPAHDVALLPVASASPMRALSDIEADELLETILSRAKPGQAKRDYAMVMTLLTCGLRLRELVDLLLEDVELGPDQGYLMVGSSSAAGGRVIPFGMAPAKALQDYLRVRPNAPGEGRFFLNREGRPIAPRTVQRIVAHYAQAAGLENVSTQTLRMTFAHAMFKGTGDLETVARLMGHSSTTTTARYFDLGDS